MRCYDRRRRKVIEVVSGTHVVFKKKRDLMITGPDKPKILK